MKEEKRRVYIVSIRQAVIECDPEEQGRAFSLKRNEKMSVRARSS